MKSNLSKLTVLTIVFVTIGSTAFGQGKTMTRSFDAETAFLMSGLNALVLEKDGKLILEMIPPKNQLPKEMKDVDLNEGDQLMMLNGKKLNSVEDLREMYDAIKEGESVKFGIKNKSGMSIVSFDKPAGGGHGGGKMMMMTTTMDENGGGESSETKMFGPDGKEINVVPLFDAGVMLAEEDKGVVIVVVMPDGKDKMNGELPDSGDVVKKINDQLVSSMDEFNAIYKKIKIGDSVTIEFMRDGKKLSFSFDRSNAMPSGDVEIKREIN